jgi:hypothetical protein
MGTQRDASCDFCGYSTCVTEGGTMRGFAEYSAKPVSCPTCRAITSANERKLPLTCDKCGSAGVTELENLRRDEGPEEMSPLDLLDREGVTKRYPKKSLQEVDEMIRVVNAMRIEDHLKALEWYGGPHWPRRYSYQCPRCQEFQFRVGGLRLLFD